MLYLVKLAADIEVELKKHQPDGGLCHLEVKAAGVGADALVRVVMWVGHDIGWLDAQGIRRRNGGHCVWSDIESAHAAGYLAWLQEGRCGLPSEYRAHLVDPRAARIPMPPEGVFGDRNHGV